MTDEQIKYFNEGRYNAGRYNIGNFNTGNHNEGDLNRGNFNSGSGNIGYYNFGGFNIGSFNDGSRNIGNFNDGYWNIGDHNNGYFNTGHQLSVDPHKVRAFNGPLVDPNEFHNACPSWLFSVEFAEWVPIARMSETEKVYYHEYEIQGGCIRATDIKAAWAKAYATASADDIQAVRDLPGFDATVFHEITGLDFDGVNKDDYVPATITINGKIYVLKE